jgi:hypothetical protein
MFIYEHNLDFRQKGSKLIQWFSVYNINFTRINSNR